MFGDDSLYYFPSHKVTYKVVYFLTNYTREKATNKLIVPRLLYIVCMIGFVFGSGCFR